jgi:hypothetical protein
MTNSAMTDNTKLAKRTVKARNLPPHNFPYSLPRFVASLGKFSRKK